MVRPTGPGMLVLGPRVRSGLRIVVTWTETIVQAVFPMDMGSKWVGLLEYRQQMWWIVVLLSPTGPGILFFGQVVGHLAVGRVMICPGMLDEHIKIELCRVVVGVFLSFWMNMLRVLTLWRPLFGPGCVRWCCVSVSHGHGVRTGKIAGVRQLWLIVACVGPRGTGMRVWGPEIGGAWRSRLQRAITVAARVGAMVFREVLLTVVCQELVEAYATMSQQACYVDVGPIMRRIERSRLRAT